MRFFKFTIYISFIIWTSKGYTQSISASLNADYYHLIDRYEIKSGSLSKKFHSDVKPFARKSIVELAESLDDRPDLHLNRVDKFNLMYLKNDSWEWAKDNNIPESDSRSPLFRELLKKKSDFYYFQNKDVDIHISPTFQFGTGTDNLSSSKPFINTRGVEIRGVLNKKLSFYSEFSDNQLIYPNYVRSYIRNYQGFPYQGFTKVGNNDSTKMYSDFFDARAFISFQALKNLTIQFGHDKNFIGSGIRSLILSDFSPAYLQLRANATVGRVQYMSIFAQLQNRQLAIPGDSLLPKKFMAFHHLNVNIGKNLNIGVFETVMFGKRPLGFDLNYLNPIIFYRYVESSLGSADNSIVGLDFKYNFLKTASIYGQVVLDEWLAKHIFAQDGYVGNKYALQIGGKYIDALFIPNLDLQVEYNVVRPYTYSHFSTYSNFVNFNLPMADPWGANFKEFLFVARYQPVPQLFLNFNYSYVQKGENLNNLDYGGNILLTNILNRPHDFGNEIGQGRSTTVTYFDIGASYMLKHNLFIDVHYQNRIYQSQNTNLNNTNNNVLFGIRWNIPQRSLMF